MVYDQTMLLVEFWRDFAGIQEVKEYIWMRERSEWWIRKYGGFD
jgi:hypothetical protein